MVRYYTVGSQKAVAHFVGVMEGGVNVFSDNHDTEDKLVIKTVSYQYGLITCKITDLELKH